MHNVLESKLRVLLIEDDEDDYILLHSMLSEVLPLGYELTWIKTYGDALNSINAIYTHGYDVCFIDYRLDNGDGLDISDRLIKLKFQVPIVILTGQGSYEVDLKAMAAGVSDYLDKSEMTPRILERSIRYAIDRKHSEIKIRQYQESLESLVDERTKDLILERNRLRESEIEREKVIKDLQAAIANIRALEGLLPICAWCKKIRNDEGYWMEIETYFLKHSDLLLTHGMCPECAKNFRKDFLDKPDNQ